jgi:ABC-type polysaccharide/polyol phosphate transport system ATPase subunit
MPQEPAIEILNLSKTFKYQNNMAALSGDRHSSNVDIYALKNISLTVHKGECMGIVGENGAGKSTLLKILAGTIKPNKGKIILHGTVSSILDIGAGLHPDLTGWENIFMGGALLGKTDREIKIIAPQIISFSGLRNFMSLPVKYYSTGMFMRLAFSIATNFDSDIILLDEVYSVGDIDFREKCTQRINRLKQEGKTIVLVSHELPAIQGLCSSCAIMSQGSILDKGETRHLVEKYVEKSLIQQQEVRKELELSSEKADKNEATKDPEESITRNTTLEPENNIVQTSTGEETDILSEIIQFKSCRIYEKNEGEINMLSEICIDVSILILKPFHGRISLHLNLGRDMPVMGLSPYRLPLNDEHVQPGTYILSTIIPGGWLNVGLYTLDFLAVDEDENLIVRVPSISYFKVALKISEKDESHYSGKFPGPLMPVLNWHLQKKK